MYNCNVEDICFEKQDSQDQKILEVYSRKIPDYAVYRTKERVSVQYADDNSHSADQRKAMAPLNPIRGEINGLLDGWRLSKFSAREQRASRYDRRVGDALVVAFEEDVTSARVLLDEIKQNILDERVAWARFEYLICAFVVGSIVAFFIWLIIKPQSQDHDGRLIWHAASAGTVGAFFSIALSIRGRTILPDLQRISNWMDAVLRILIGVIAAAVLAAFVMSKAVTIAIGDAKLLDVKPPGCGDSWLYILIIGFIAGFSERFVPDLLAKATAVTETQKQVPPTTEKKAANAPDPQGKLGPAGGKSLAAGASADAGDENDPLPDEARSDDCACSIDLPDSEATKDADLPAATGGVVSTPPAVVGGRP